MIRSTAPTSRATNLSRGFEGVLGVILASSTVPRLHGEIGEPTSNPASTLYETTVFENFLAEMREGLRPTSFDRLMACRDALVARGASCIATSCGLLWPAQSRLQAGCPVPFISSALCLLDQLRMEFAKGICIVTVDDGFVPYWRQTQGTRLDGIDFCALGRDSYLYAALTGAIPPSAFCAREAERSVLDILQRHRRNAPHTKLWLLECTNLSPYSSAIRATFGLPVRDIYSAVHMLGRRAG